MKYFIDIDGTICITPMNAENRPDYTKSTPIPHRIKKVNELRRMGHHITLWTARGATTGIDHTDLTTQQLRTWGVDYDVLSIGAKPAFDVLIDDKSWNVDEIWRSPMAAPPPQKKSGDPQEIVEKTWGREVVIVNTPLYCGKILQFRAGWSGSLHFHLKKTETWYVSRGQLILSWPDPATGIIYSEFLNVGDVVTHKPGEAHLVEAVKDSDIFEISTQHFDDDTYRVAPKK